ncbi:transposase, mutator family protein [Nitzschia inconspicua]|uniref:Transposase, mutator family protein n=1 Tax=Nitzschia inconspicua TaxID=303405 RepID=A0A9K3LM93_9STRA|nr:transposase, mutator family protein [Nitzschia inconspicua]
MKDGEDAEGWKWFLELLVEAIPLLKMQHPYNRCRFCYFTVISDRQKGLIQALQQVFPDNHHCFCSVHIARNVEKEVGKKVAKLVHALSATFSKRESDELMAKINAISARGKKYLEGISANQWRSTAWVDDPTLPPRFGIVTTNMSESVNSMVGDARDGSWLECTNDIVRKMMNRICSLREENYGREGVVDKVAEILESRWKNCSNFQVREVVKGGSQFDVFRPSRGASQPETNRLLDVREQTCECGKWQEHGVPCIDAVAYYRLFETQTLQYIMDNHVSEHYKYETVNELLKENIVPVSLDILDQDGVTLPPNRTKRPSTRVDTAVNIVTFLRSNVFVHEQHFARCFYVDVRGFDAYSNTCLEGTNYGVKYCENRVLPNMSQAKATKVMINQDEDKFTQNRKKASDAFHKTPLQARTNTSAHVLQTAESMLQQAMVASESYISYRVCERKWWVLYSGHRNLPVRLLPVFERFGTNFESFTHHSVDIRFWTAYSLYSVVLQASELNEDELNIRNKLVTARWKSPQTPTAPASMKSMDEGRYSVGSKSEDKFMSMTGEDLFLYFQALMKNKLSILNYNIENVEKAVAVMEKHQGNVVGMTQEMQNCSADFSFFGPGDETSDVADPVGSHEVLNPLYKELTQLCDIAGKDKTAKTARDLETLISALKEEITSEQ